MREIILDTETTGLDRKVDRIVEIGAIEMVDLMPTGRTYHQYCNPLRPVHKEAYRVHGLSDVFLSTKPTFKRIHGTFLRFIGDARLVAHNASFDIGMLNEELDRLDLDPLKNEVVDTLQLAREKHPRRKHTLDALCSIYNIDDSRRTLHGALLDAELLAEVYAELRGGRQFGMQLDMLAQPEGDEEDLPVRVRPVPLAKRITEKDVADHRAFVATLGDAAIWRNYV
ncbi:DNA polymerase III subunit epsilon [Bradyrhizobium ottawaense]|uniref:DNA polymerase III subunit epsilon n=1 Tax=Bradyrhizobium ottawaense TaxID=931866 RepID=A0ABY0QHF8_9BRAD|nr:DNA polymerase III subunit epsilon [Bradyrhizobium ottawaense]SDK45486.1 DNA polymerase-3 subunit epsilon [Bradyrhizobium ottawaense]